MPRPHIVFCTQEVWPFVEGGGIGRYIGETVRLLTGHADVSIVAPGRWREEHERLAAAGDPRLPPARFVWVDEPEGDVRPFVSWYHAYSECCWRALRDLARSHPPDLVEFDDYRGLGAVPIQAKRAAAPELAGVPLMVRTHTSWEMAAHLDGVDISDRHSRAVCAVERVALRFADLCFAPSRETAQAYEDFYGDGGVARATIVSQPFSPPAQTAAAPELPLRFLYAGRMQALKGVAELVEAFVALDSPDVTLTLVGGDTPTGPGGGSMRDYLRRVAAGDPRIAFRDRVSPGELGAIMGDHHVVVVPSAFENFGYVAREALGHNRPVISRPVGGLAALHAAPGAGWTVTEPGADGLRTVLAAVAGDAAGVLARIADGAPRAALEADDTAAKITAAYLDAAGRSPAPQPGGVPAGQVTAIVCAADRGDLGATLESLAAQTAGQPEIVLVGDGHQLPATVAADHAALVEIVAGGRLAARRRGLEIRRQTGPVLFLDAGQTVHPEFLERALAALDGPGQPAYVTAYGDGATLGNAPLGNAVAEITREPDLAGRILLLAPGALDLGLPAPALPGLEDHALVRELAHRHRFGAVLPERLTGPVRRARATSALPAHDHDLGVELETSPPPRAHVDHAVGEDTAHLAEAFGAIYAEATWTDAIPGMPSSGRGALPSRSASVIRYVREEIAAGRVGSIVDIGCGDLTYVSEIPEITGGQVDYLGIDVVPDLIERHRELPWGRFEVADITADGFRIEADLVICKDVLFHLSDAQVMRTLQRLRASAWRELVITSQPTDGAARDFDRWHYAPLDLEAPPYGLRAARRLERVEGGAFLVVTHEALAAGLSDA